MKTIFIAASIMIAGMWLAVADVYAAGVDHTLFASLLSSHVKDGVLDYQGFKADEAILDQYLRERFKDPRVHFAVNCASKSCPPLQGDPFEASHLNDQLNQAAKVFINTPRFNRLDGNTLWVSKIFDWFPEDFDGDVIGYFIEFADVPMREQLEKNKGRIKVKYLDYDWSLNGS